MRNLPPLALLLFAMNLQAQQDFSKFKWKNRLVVFSAASLSSEGYKAQMDAFLAQPKKLQDRNVMLLTLVKAKIFDAEGKALTNYDVAALRKKYELPLSFEGFVLIGKDGGVKMKKYYPTDVNSVFSTIDQMPMRKTEMRENIDDR